MEATKIINTPYVDDIEQAKKLHEQLSTEYKMEATKKLIQDGRWRPMEECADGAEVLTIMKHGVISGIYTKADGECGGYYWHDLSWYPSKFRPLPDNRLADALEVAFNEINNLRIMTGMGIIFDESERFKQLRKILIAAEQALAKIEQIAKGENDDNR